MRGRLASLALAALAPAAQHAPTPQSSIAEMVEGFLAGYRSATELGQRSMCMRMIAEATRRSDPTPDPVVARALGVGLEDASFPLRAEILAWLLQEDRATVRALLPPAGERLAAEALERAGVLDALAEPDERRDGRNDRPPGPLSPEERLRVSQLALLAHEIDELGAYGAALVAALAEQRDEPALDALLALEATDERTLLDAPARRALARVPVRRALERIATRMDELTRELPRAEGELETASALRKRWRPPKGWEPAAWERSEDERVDGAIARARERLEELAAERDALRAAFADLARVRSLPEPPRADARPGAWERWWEENRDALPETLDA